MERPLSAGEFTAAAELMRALAQRHRCLYWLLDSRAGANIRLPDVCDRLTDESLPRARPDLGRSPCIAFLAEPRFWQALQEDYPPRQAVPAVLFRAGSFTQETEALGWLAAQRAS